MTTRTIDGNDITTLTFHEGNFGANNSKVEVLLNNGTIITFRPEYYESYNECTLDCQISAPNVWRE